MPGRRKRVPNVYNLDVHVTAAATATGAHFLLAAFIKHLVFAREQCHAPYNELAAHVQACIELQRQQQQIGRSARMKSSSRKAIKYLDRLSAMLQLVPLIPVSDLHGLPVAVLLGSSVLRPREVYCFNFPTDMEQPGVAPPSEKQLSTAARQLLRALVMEHQSITEWDAAPGPTKMFLLFQAREGSLACPPQGFTAKRAFSVNLRKAFQVNIHLSGQRAGEAVPAAAGEDGELQQLSQRMSTQMHLSDTGTAALPQPPVWYQCAVHVKGLRPASS